MGGLPCGGAVSDPQWFPRFHANQGPAPTAAPVTASASPVIDGRRPTSSQMPSGANTRIERGVLHQATPAQTGYTPAGAPS